MSSQIGQPAPPSRFARQDLLDFWWWGEDEAPGLGGWVQEATSTFEQATGIRVNTRLLRHDEVLSELPRAAARREAPDLHFLWNGMYHVDFVWKGLLRPLDHLFSPEEMRAFGGGPQSTVDGQTYRLSWYVIPVTWVANRAVLDRAGVTDLPTNWDELRDACARVLAAGLRPVTTGDGEGDFSVWWLTHFLTQACDRASELPDLALGKRDWQEGRYNIAWRLLAEVHKAGFLDEDALHLTLWEGLARFNEGLSAFTLASGPMFAACRRALGASATVFTAPRVSSRALSGLPIVDTQGLGICESAGEPRRASELLRTFYEPARRERLWKDVGLFPADRRWAGPLDSGDHDYATMWRWYAYGPTAPYLPNLLPLELHFQLAAGIGQDVLSRRLAPERAGEVANQLCARWAGQADVGRYGNWAATLASQERA